MNDHIRKLLIILYVAAIGAAGSAPASAAAGPLRVSRFLAGGAVELASGQEKAVVHRGERFGVWTLMEIISQPAPKTPGYVIVEDFTRQDGHLAFVNAQGIQSDLPKSLEPTFADPSRLYRGHTLDEVMDSARDLLGSEILASPGDPEYAEVANCFPPIRNVRGAYTFIGTHDTIDKVGVTYGGRTPNFDPAPYDPRIWKLREDGKVWDGLVGGWLPVIRFVYPQDQGNWTEMIAFAPVRVSNANPRIQPVWYRVSRIENSSLKWVKYIDSYHPFPPRTEYDPQLFYRDLLAMEQSWNRMLEPGMKISVPDERIGNMARYSLVRDMMTRVGDFPKYGAFDKDYAGSEHDGFPDTFTVDTQGMLEWGLVGLAGRYIDNYFGQFVRDDGSILYRGPETGQYGRMLTVLAQFVDYGGDPAILLRRRSRIDGVAKLLLYMRAKALELPKSDPAYGMIAGWSEADACLDPDPPRYMQPYFSNSTEAARGFRDLGRAWEKIGAKNGDAGLSAWGKRLVREAAALRADIDTAISRSMLDYDGEKILPSIAGVKEPFHIVVPRDTTDPQYRSYRAYMEMLHSGSLTKEQVRTIVNYRASHHDTILGVPTAYGHQTGEMAGFLSYGHGYGLIQHDMVREALLTLYGVMAHQYTRGTWNTPETRSIKLDRPAAPYCSPAQMVVPLMSRWMLVFEDPESETLWLAKATPRKWLEDGKATTVAAAPTRWGRVGYSIVSKLSAGSVSVRVDLPAAGLAATTQIRLRVPGERKLTSVTLNGKDWKKFDPAQETISIPAGTAGVVRLVARYGSETRP
ncbi:MAG TPA: hypothetical protein VHA11_13890 [Bryobacteraceae bacterium]|nr:hypothetical protein [Bryobacteraceae bacterium]